MTDSNREAVDRLLNHTIEKRPATEVIEGRRVIGVRDPVAGEVGYDHLKDSPEVQEYSKANLQALLTRTMKGCGFLLENLTSEKGYEQIGLLINLLDKTHDMLIAHDVKRRLGG